MLPASTSSKETEVLFIHDNLNSSLEDFDIEPLASTSGVQNIETTEVFITSPLVEVQMGSSKKEPLEWRQWNPKMLKAKKNPFLNKHANSCIKESSNSYYELMKLKIKLAEKQIINIERDNELKEEELLAKRKINKLIIQSYELDIQKKLNEK